MKNRLSGFVPYCQAKGWHLLKIYTDGGYSGGNTNRPALQQMLLISNRERQTLLSSISWTG